MKRIQFKVSFQCVGSSDLCACWRGRWNGAAWGAEVNFHLCLYLVLKNYMKKSMSTIMHDHIKQMTFDSQIYMFVLWHSSTIQPAMHFSPLLSSAHGNTIRSGDGQINRNTLICVAHVPKLDWGRTPYTPFHLSAEWREGMERSRRGHQCSQWINSATVKTRQAETSQLSELFLPSASCLHAAQLHYVFFFC